MTFKSAEQIQTAEGKQYHIGCKPGDLNPYILLCGDPARVEKTAKHFKNPTKPICHREFVTVSGNYEGVPVSVMATGMGSDNTEIAVIEICQIVKNPTFIRIGSCGGLKKGIALGDLVISQGAVRLENTTSYFVCEGYPAVAHYEVVAALVAAAKELKHPFHLGLTATAPGFYGAQGRRIPGFSPLDPDLPQKLAAMNVSNLEMEASALFVLSHLRGVRAGAVCAVYGNRHANKFIDEKMMKLAESRCIATGLKAIAHLAKKHY